MSVVFLRIPGLCSGMVFQDIFRVVISVKGRNMGQVGNYWVGVWLRRTKDEYSSLRCRVWYGVGLDKEVTLQGRSLLRMNFKISFPVYEYERDTWPNPRASTVSTSTVVKDPTTS